MNQHPRSLLRISLLVAVAGLSWTLDTATGAQEKMPFSTPQSNAILTRLRAVMREQGPRFFSPKTHAWYAVPLDQLPPAKDVRNLYPNPVGYGTGMDDCPLFEGLLLVALVELHDLTRAECLRQEAFEAYQGLKLCGTAHGVPGFVARGVCVEDGKSIYVTSSRDQYTHYVDGLWHYYHSPLCDAQSKQEIRELLTVLADAMREQILEENDFGYLRADGAKDPRGLHKMWHVYAHEAARLPMIYAAAWDVAGRKADYDLYRQYLTPAIEQSIELKNKPLKELNAWVPPYSYLQMQCSLALLYRLEKEVRVKARILDALEVAKALASRKTAWAAKRNRRELAEVLLAQLMINKFALPEEQKPFVGEALSLPHLGKGGPPTTIHLFALYCKACQAGLLPVPTHVPPETWAPASVPRDADQTKPLFPAPKRLVKDTVDENLVVLLSDPHVGAGSGEAKKNLVQFKTFCDRILAMKPRPAAVIIAGDLAFAEGGRPDYASVKPILEQFDAAGIPWRVCFGESDRRMPFYEVFPRLKAKTPPVPGRHVGVLELPRADFVLLDTSQEGSSCGVIDAPQREWLRHEIAKYQRSGKRFFVVAHHPAADLAIVSLLEHAPSCVGWINGHEHAWTRDAKSALKRFGLQSTAYATNASTRRGFTYLKMDQWEFIFRPVSPNPDDVWERRTWVVRFAR